MGQDALESWIQLGLEVQFSLPLLSGYNTKPRRRILERKIVYLRTKYRWNDPIKMEGTEK
jgi:hypothetical protein